jgi:GDPmannose 4,6-dehydratase
MKIGFITGITGQDGSYLAELLLEKNYKVYGIVRRNSSIFNYDRIEHIQTRLHLEYGDLTDGSSLMIVLNKVINENYGISRFEIYNLGAQSHVQISFDNPEYTSLVDGIGTLKILEAIRTLPKHIRDITRFYQAGTSEMFGAVLEKPQKETTPFNPQSPYACAKVYSHFLVNNYRDAYGLFACNGILFNHESSRRGYNFVTMKIVRGVKRIREEMTSSIIHENPFILELGNLDSMRDWGYAKNYVYGMWLMLQHNKPDNYVLATNKSYSVRDFVERCFRKIGVEIVWEGDGLLEMGIDKNTGRICVKINEKFFRPCEVDYLLGDASKAEKELGWKSDFGQQNSLNDLIDEMFQNW